MAREMKDSGIEWIGEIPASFKIIRVKQLGDYRNGLTYSPENIVDEGEGTLVLRSSNIQQGKLCFNDNVYVNSDVPEQLLVKKGDIIICSRNGSRELIGKCAIVEDDIVASFGAFMMVFRGDSPKYMYYILNSDVFKYYLSSFLTSTINQLTGRNFGEMAIVWCDDKAEQNRIVTFLDKECARIDSVIDKTRASIEEYKKLKQAVITQAVTKGIRPDRQMKDSGVEWIGEIPSDWNILRKLSYSVNKPISYGIIKLFDPDDENGVKVIRCSDVREGIIDSNNIRTVTKEISDEYSRTILEGGEVLINVRGTLGGCAVVPTEMKGYNIAREVAMVSIDNTLLNKFLMYYFLSDAFINYENRHLAGSVYIGLNIEMLSACPITLPSTVEQQGIVDYLDEKTGEINRLIEKKQQLLSDLDSYKKSLIYEYVTGKKEVPA